MPNTKARKPYSTDLSDDMWALLAPLLPHRERKRKYPLREILNSIFYVLRTGCQWRLLPHDLPPWQSVYYYFRHWRQTGMWGRLNTILRQNLREAHGRDPEPSAAIIDSQSVKTTEARGVRGYDAGKKIKGRKRHILVDTLGLLLMVVVHPANIQDRAGAKTVFTYAKFCLTRLQLIWADGGYTGQLVDWVATVCTWTLTIVKRTVTKGFQVLPKRWIVERTFGWLGRSRRLSKDYEGLTTTSEAFIYVAMIQLMARRLAVRKVKNF